MERIGIEDIRQHLSNIIKRVESGEEIMLTRNGRDVAHITKPCIYSTQRIQTFFSLLKRLKARTSIHATPDEIKQWIQDGRT